MSTSPSFAEAVLLLRPEFACILAYRAEICAAPAASYLRAAPRDMQRIILAYFADSRIHAAEYLEEARANFAQFCKLYALPSTNPREYASQYLFSAATLRRDYPDLDTTANMTLIKFTGGHVISNNDRLITLRRAVNNMAHDHRIPLRHAFTLHGRLPCGLVYVSNEYNHCLIDPESGKYQLILPADNCPDYIYDDYGNKQFVHGNDEKMLQLGEPGCYNAVIFVR